MKNIMFRTSRMIFIPKSFSCKILYLFPFFFIFQFADLSWFFFASSHNQNTSQGCKPESFFEKFILFLRSSDYTKGVYKKVGQSTQGRLARNRVCVAFSLILIEGHRCWYKNNFLTHLIFSLSA